MGQSSNDIFPTAMHVQDSLVWVCLIRRDASVRLFWRIRSFPFVWPRDAFDGRRKVVEAALQGVVVVLRVGKALDVGVHAVLDIEHDDVIEATVCAVESGKQ